MRRHPGSGEFAPMPPPGAPYPRARTWYERLTIPRAIATILVIAGVMVTAASFLARLVEPEVFDNIGISYWWAITTLTTVGYGDVVPESTGGRLVGVMLMLGGLALIPTTTSVVVTLLIHKFGQTEQAADRQERRELAARLARIEEKLDRLEEPPR
jgi:voltage-gated potassium channel